MGYDETAAGSHIASVSPMTSHFSFTTELHTSCSEHYFIAIYSYFPIDTVEPPIKRHIARDDSNSTGHQVIKAAVPHCISSR